MPGLVFREPSWNQIDVKPCVQGNAADVLQYLKMDKKTDSFTLSVFSVIANAGLSHISEAILNYVSNKDLCSMRLVCKSFKDFIATQKFWSRRIS